MSDESGYSLGIDLGQTPWRTATAERDAPRDAVVWPAVGNDTLSGAMSVESAESAESAGQIVTLVAAVVDLLTERRGTAPAVVVLALPTDGQFADDDIAGSVAERLRPARGSARIVDAADAAVVGLAYLRGETTGAGGSSPERSTVAIGAALLGLDEEHRTGAGIATAGGAAVGGLGATVLSGGSTGAGVGAVTGAVGAVGVPIGAAGAVGAVGVPIGAAAGVGAVGVPIGAAVGVGAVGVPIGAAVGPGATGTALGPRLRRLARHHRTALLAGGVTAAAVAITVAVLAGSSTEKRSVVRAVSSVPSSVGAAPLDSAPADTTQAATTTEVPSTTIEMLPVIVVATTEPPPPTPIPVIFESPSTAVAATTPPVTTAAPTTSAVPVTTPAVASTKRPSSPTAPRTAVRPVSSTVVASTPPATVGTSGATCAVGSWVVDNASAASAFAGAAPAGAGQIDVAGVTGGVRVTIAANGAAVTTFDNWKLSATLPDGTVAVVSKAGSETSTIVFADDGTFVVSGAQINSTTQVSMAGTVFLDGPSKDALLQHGRSFTCRGDRLEIRVSGTVDYMVAMSRGA